MTSTSTPCRLSVFLSSKSNTGVILRRGPSRWAQLIHWDRSNDEFTPGQWFHGRVYERRCDLSPDGKLFIYFAGKYGARHRDGNEIGEAWTAISKPPYFTALALWTNLGSWYGGGIFKTDNHVLLDATCTLDPHPDFHAGKLNVQPMEAATSPWEQRLLRDQWKLIERGFDPRTHKRAGRREVWEKQHPGTAVRLCRELEDVDFQRHGGPYFEVFWLEAHNNLIPIENASWADWDRWDRLVFVRDGIFFSATLSGTGLHTEELYDFNPLQPGEVETPDWAKRW